MCLKWFKKKKVIIDSKFKKGQPVAFRYRDDLKIGYIYEIRQNEEGQVVYDIQVGGECPVIYNNILEEIIRER